MRHADSFVETLWKTDNWYISIGHFEAGVKVQDFKLNRGVIE